MAVHRIGVHARQLLLVAMYSAMAASPGTAQGRVHPWIAPAAGLSGYGMDSISREIHLLGQIFRPQYRFHEIRRGPSAGLQVGVDIAPGWRVAFGYDWLWASSDARHPAQYDLGAYLFQGVAGYQLRVNPVWSVGVEAGAGRVTLSGARVRPDVTVNGHAGAWEASAIAHRRVGTIVSIVMRTGYRHAVIGTVTHDGAVLLTPDGSELDVDYSGAFGQAGFQLRWP